MKVMKWPGPDSKIKEVTSTEDMYTFMKWRREEKEEIVAMQQKIGELLEEVKEDTALRLLSDDK